MDDHQQESTLRASYKKILNQHDAEYSSPNFESLLVEAGVSQVGQFQTNNRKFSEIRSFWRKLNPRQGTGIILFSELIFILGFVFYLNNPYPADEKTAMDLIGEFSLETI